MDLTVVAKTVELSRARLTWDEPVPRRQVERLSG